MTVSVSIRRLVPLVAVAALIVAGCGSSSNSSTSSTSQTSGASPTAAATSGAMGSSMKGGPSPLAAAAPIPASLQCSDAIVWVNTKSRVYHMSGDPFYGRTKQGEYMCQGAADGHGYHLAGTPRHHTGMAQSPEPSST